MEETLYCNNSARIFLWSSVYIFLSQNNNRSCVTNNHDALNGRQTSKLMSVCVTSCTFHVQHDRIRILPQQAMVICLHLNMCDCILEYLFFRKGRYHLLMCTHYCITLFWCISFLSLSAIPWFTDKLIEPWLFLTPTWCCLTYKNKKNAVMRHL